MEALRRHSSSFGLYWKAGAVVLVLSLCIALVLGFIFIPLALVLAWAASVSGILPLTLSEALFLMGIAWLPLSVGAALPIASEHWREERARGRA